MLTYAIPTYNSFDQCISAIHAVMRNSIRPDELIIIDDSGTGAALDKIVPVMQGYFDTGYINLKLWVHNRQCGVSASWNQFLENASGDYVLIANDDVIPYEDAIKQMLDATTKYPNELFFAGDSISGNSFSFFMVPRVKFIETMGLFDENFFPAYFEDNDMSRRITLAGYKHIYVDGALYDHAGSSTLHNYTPEKLILHHEQFRANERYFIAKWGGKPGQEIFTTPGGE